MPLRHLAVFLDVVLFRCCPTKLGIGCCCFPRTVSTATTLRIHWPFIDIEINSWIRYVGDHWSNFIWTVERLLAFNRSIWMWRRCVFSWACIVNDTYGSVFPLGLVNVFWLLMSWWAMMVGSKDADRVMYNESSDIVSLIWNISDLLEEALMWRRIWTCLWL